MEWDNYAGVENMISSAVTIANNVIDGWDNGVQLDAATGISIVYNTVVDGTGIQFNHRTPHDQANNVILDGNQAIRVWNNILPSIALAAGESRPTFESNNVVWQDGGGGNGLITMDPQLDMTSDYALSAGSPAVDAAVDDADNPLVDFDNHLRGTKPDIGARELGATELSCP
jgi:hypothetical protein